MAVGIFLQETFKSTLYPENSPTYAFKWHKRAMASTQQDKVNNYVITTLEYLLIL